MRRSILRGALLALPVLAAPLGGAHAQSLPKWSIAEICAKESAPGQCAAFEGRALNAVSASWPFVLDPVKQACLGQLKTPADHSWRLLAECIDAETLKVLDKTAVQTARTPAEPVPPPRPPVEQASPPASGESSAAPPSTSAAGAAPPPAAAAPASEPPKAQ